MIGNLQLLRNFVEKFMGTFLLGMIFYAITRYGYYVQGNLTICHVYYGCEGLGLLSIFWSRHFYDGRFYVVAFRSNTCYVWNLEGDDLITDSRDSNLYTISISEMASSSLVCLISRATSTKSWLWHHRISHLNFGTIDQLMSKDLVDGLPKFKYNKDHLCSTYEQRKSKKASLLPKLVPSTESKLEKPPNLVPSIESKLEYPSSAEQVATEPNSPILNENADELTQEDIADFDGNVFYNAPPTLMFEEAESSSTYQDPSNMHDTKFYTMDLLKKYAMAKYDTISTPMATTKLDADLQDTQVDQTKYRSMIGGLMYLTASQPYIAFATFYSKDYGFKLIAYSDADLAGCNDDCKSTSGGSQFLGDRLVSWSSKKQDCIAMSTAEAEYISLSACYAQVIWMRTQLLDYGFWYNKIPMYYDSQSEIAISCNPVQHSRTKHINIRYHFIKEHVERGSIQLYFVGTEYQLADLFTKAFPKESFEYLVYRIGMRCMTPTELERLAKLCS
ncbi:retrovirus-related pol polyprotein from transposon TNT 1-94 [Tanacetum coccineum]